MDALPLVSVIIFYFNQGQRLMEAVSSVEAQTYENLEILVVDDGSLGVAAAEVLGRRQIRPLRILRHAMFAGPAAAKNAGVVRSSGELLAFLEADDKMSDNFIERAVSAVRANPATELVYSAVTTFGGFSETRDPSVTIPDLLSGEEPPRAFLCTRAVYEFLSGYQIKFKSAETSDFWLRAIAGGKRSFKLDEPLTFCRVGPGTRSADEVLPQRIVVELAEQHRDLYKRNLAAVLTAQKLKHLEFRALAHGLRTETERLRQQLTERHRSMSEQLNSQYSVGSDSDVLDVDEKDGIVSGDLDSFDPETEVKPGIFKRLSSLLMRQTGRSEQSTSRPG